MRSSAVGPCRQAASSSLRCSHCDLLQVWNGFQLGLMLWAADLAQRWALRARSAVATAQRLPAGPSGAECYVLVDVQLPSSHYRAGVVAFKPMERQAGHAACACIPGP